MEIEVAVARGDSVAKQRETEPRERILESAETLFSRYGLEKTTLADIARRAHLSKATLYHHFPDGKESIFRVVVDRIIETEWQRLVAHVRKGRTPDAQLRRYLAERIAIFDRETLVRGIGPVVWADLKPWIEHALESHLERERGFIREILDEGAEQGSFRPVDPDFGARLIQSALRGLTIDGPLEPTALEREHETEELIAFIERALAPRG